MPILRIIQKRAKFGLAIPHKLWINGRMLGIMKDKEVNIEMPAGQYAVTIQSMFPFLSATANVRVGEGAINVLSFHDREKWWDYLFTIDMVLWIAEFFFTLPAPWGLIYKICTNGYFVIWLIYEWIIRKRYFLFETYQVTE